MKLFTKNSQPPGPLLQNINTLVQWEPLASVVNTLYWSLVLSAAAPVATAGLVLRNAVRLATRRVAYYENKTNDKCVVITGCDTGFGHELAVAAAKKGFTVFAGCLNTASFADEIPDNLIPIVMDVTKDYQVQAAVMTVEKWLAQDKGRVMHALVNNAGVGVMCYLDFNTMSDHERVMSVNYFGLVRCCNAFLPILKKQAIDGTHNNSRILNMVSMAGLVTTPGLGVYCASKHAANTYSSILRRELKSSFGIQVTTFNPCYHATPMVEDMEEKGQKYWEDVDPVKREEYGEDFFNETRSFTIDMPRAVTWRSSNVINKMMQSLMMKYTPPDLVIGIDGLYNHALNRMLPQWAIDMVWSLVGLPVAKAMKGKL